VSRPPNEVRCFSVIVSGPMQPAIHHPAWYAQLGILDEQSKDSALKGTDFVCTPLFARFTVPRFSVFCETPAWRISFMDPDSFCEAERVVERVFDKALPGGPVSAFALQFEHHLLTAEVNVGECLAAKLSAFPIPISLDGANSASISLSAATKAGRLEMRIEPSVRAANMVFVAHVFSYDARALAISGQFSLSEAVHRFYAADEQTSVSRSARIVAAINQGKG